MQLKADTVCLECHKEIPHDEAGESLRGHSLECYGKSLIFFNFPVLEIEPRALCIQSTHSTTELHPQPPLKVLAKI